MIIVDNGSIDNTGDVVRDAAQSFQHLDYLYVSTPGVSNAKNAAINAASGEILLFTDDDVIPSEQWIVRMGNEMAKGGYGALAGGICMHPSLKRPWMTRQHSVLLASTECLNSDEITGVIGANCAVRKDVFNVISPFDPELGPGALGFQEESLLSRQMLRAGLTIGARLDITAEHNFDVSRLSRSSFIDRVRREGRSLAYIAHHWEHKPAPASWKQQLRSILFPFETLCSVPNRRSTGSPISDREMRLIQGLGYFEQFIIERQRPRNYEKFGLIKMRGILQ